MQFEKAQALPNGRKRATISLALGAYANMAVLIVQGLLLVPLYIQFLGAHLYGLWLASGGILGLLSIVNFGVASMMIQRIASAYGQLDLPKVSAYFINGLFVYLLISTLFVITGILISFTIPFLIKASIGNEELIIYSFQLAALATGLGIVNECLRGFAQALLRPLFSMISSIVIRIFGILVTVFFLYKGVGLWTIPLVMLITEGLLLITGLIQAITLFRSLHAKVMIDVGIIKEYFHVGGTLFMARVGHIFSRESDPLLITILLRPEITAAYMITRRAADIASQLLSVIYGSTHSAFSHLAGQGDHEKILNIATKLMMTVFILGVIGFVIYVGVNHSFVGLWVGEVYSLNQEIILLIGLAYFASSLRNVILQILNGLGDFEFSSRVIILEGISRVIISLLLISIFGLIGVPMSLIITSIVSSIALSMKLKREIQFKLNHFDFIKVLMLTFVIFGIGEMFALYHHTSISWLMLFSDAGQLLLITVVIFVFLSWSLFRTNVKNYLTFRH